MKPIGSFFNAVVVLLLAMTVSWLPGILAFAQNASGVDPRLPLYARPAQPVAGVLQVVSTVATAALVAQWIVALQDLLPELDVQTTSLETAMLPPWWTIAGPHTIAVLAQPMTDEERVAFVQQFGYRPTRLRVAQDAVVVIVHRSNPIVRRGITLPELDAMFSTTRVRGHADLKSWGGLGMGGIWAQRPMTLYGHDAAASLYVYFRRRVLKDGDFKATVARLPSSDAVVAAVSSDINAIGYASINTVTDSVSTVPLANAPGQSAVTPTIDTVQQQRYPLMYFVSLYLKQVPGTQIEPPCRSCCILSIVGRANG